MNSRNRDRHDLIFSPDALRELSAGFGELATVLSITLGPTQGTVAHTTSSGVELLTSSGTIARRVTEISGRPRNTGAMLLRNLAWSVQERAGDGAATAAVLAACMVREAVRLIEAGVDPLLLRDGMETGTRAAVRALDAQAKPAEGQNALERVAASVTADHELAIVLGEMFDILGKNAFVHIEEMATPYLDREYIQGGYWKARPAGRAMIPAGDAEVVLQAPLVMVIDQGVESIEQIQPALEVVSQMPGKPPLLIVANRIGGQALELINLNNARSTLSAYATVPRSTGSAQSDSLSDIALMTGAEVLADMLGRSPAHVRPSALGMARQAVMSKDSLTVIRGAGDRSRVQRRVDELRVRLTHLDPSEENCANLRARVACLEGGVGILRIGALTKTERDDRRKRAERAIRVLATLEGAGLVPGGGVAYLNSVDAVLTVRDTCERDEERLGVGIVAKALEAPFMQLARNHGLIEPAVALDEARRFGEGHGLDVASGVYVCMEEAGILDSLAVVRGALQMATSAAAVLITTSAVVLPSESKRDTSVEP